MPSYAELRNSTFCQSFVLARNASGTSPVEAVYGVGILALIILVIAVLWIALSIGYVAIRKKLYQDKVSHA